jgi:conjugative relaxase-like TrwC/TraI family protein
MIQQPREEFMLRIQPIANAKDAEDYYAKSDGGYYYQPGDVRQEWFGQGAKELGLSGTPEFEQFKRLIHGLDPHTGEQLTAKLIEERIPGVDVNVHCPKGVTIAINRGDSRLSDAMWASAHEAVAEMEKLATTRVRQDGRQEDRLTGNLVGYGVGHHEGRPAKDDNMADWHEHGHIVIFNLTRDSVEDQWKAVKFRTLIDQRKLFDRYFNQFFSQRAAELGYAVKTLYKPDGKGGKAYKGWDIEGIPQSLIDRTSRRTQEIDATEKSIVQAIKQQDPDAPDHLSAVAKDKLGGTTRQAKRKDVTLADYREYWKSRVTPEEGREVAATIDRARQGENPKPQPKAEAAMSYAIAHHFQRSSVVDFNDLAITAMEKCMGGALPKDFEPEAKRQGVLFDGGKVTTKAVWEQEQKIIGFARAGKGIFAPLAADRDAGLSGLSDEQKAAVRHVWQSTDQVMLIRGGAGTGKTTMMKPALDKLGAPVVLLAPSADASRTTLRKEGFAEANTVAAFLGQKDMQEKVRGGGIIWVDEAGLLAIKDLDRLCSVASSLDARIVLQGDPRQHKSVDRHGNMLTVLEDFAALPVAKLTKIQRQKGDYAGAVAAIRDGDLKTGDAVLRNLGWIIEDEGHEALVAEYGKAIEERKANGDKKTVLVVDPTHKDGDILNEKLRNVRKDRGLIVGEEKPFTRLTALGWTDAERSDASRYGGDETIQFFRNSGRFKAGDRVKASDLLPLLPQLKPEHFAVYGEGQVNFAVGDTVRITGNGWDVTKKHRVDNGRIDEIKSFTPKGDIVLSNGWVIGKDFGHFKHGLVQTSPATQSKTDDIVLASMNSNSLGAMSAEQGYVTVSRGRERGMIFTNLSRDELLKAIARADNRMSATELFRERKLPPNPVAKADSMMRSFMEKVRRVYRQVQRKAAASIGETFRQKEMARGR